MSKLIQEDSEIIESLQVYNLFEEIEVEKFEWAKKGSVSSS